MKKVLLCPPAYYRIEYEINPWMNKETQIDTDAAERSYQNLKATYQKLGLEVLEITPDPELPDMVYIINTGFIVRNTFIRANFRYPQRRKEAELAAQFFQDKGYHVAVLPAEAYFEGGGELFQVGEKFFLGWGYRSNDHTKKAIEEVIQAPLIDFHLTNPYFYHLDICFAPLSQNHVVINPQAFSAKDMVKIQENFTTVIEASDKDNHLMACNLVVVGQHVVMGQGASHSLKKQIQDAGFEIHEIDMTEYIKGGGSIKCVSFMF